MTDDANQIFLREAAELVAALEIDLLDLETRPDDIDLINSAFRSLHTLKGSGAMFGHVAMSRFLHKFETAFDRLRQGKVRLTSQIIAVSLRACDQILPMIDRPEELEQTAAEVLAALDQSLGSDAEAAQSPSGVAPHTLVRFRLPPDVLRLGHDPEMLLDELRALAPAQVSALLAAIPPLEALEPTDCLIGWQVQLDGVVPREAIEEVFLFHGDEIELAIETAEPPIADVAPETADINAPPRQADAIAATGGDTMRVSTERLDELMDRVGELVIVEARLQALAGAKGDPALLAIAEDISRLAAGLRSSTMSMRMVPIGSITGRFRRLVRDLTETLGKPIGFVTQGEATELDKTVIEMITDPLVHVLRNAAGHGLESAEERRAAGKPEQGTITLSAGYAGAEVVISLSDDGRGLDPALIREKAIRNGLITAETVLGPDELYKLIFEPGFSTAAEVTEISGRGVGMDVVRRTVEHLRGHIELSSEPGHGTTVTLRLPLTLAIIDGLLVEVGGESYSIPLAAVEECVELPARHMHDDGCTAFLNIRGALVPFLRMRSLFGIEAPASLYPKVVVVQAGGLRVGLVVDRIVSNTQTVIKQLSQLHAHLRGFSGATIMGDGRVALVLDVAQIVALGREAGELVRQESAA